MRTSDMRPDTEYATCEGTLVVPVEPIHANWFHVYNHQTDEWDLIDGSDQARARQDPWGPCHKPANRGNGGLRRTKAGVLVDVYDHDRNGKRVGEPTRRVVMQPQDVAGLWKEYLTLYADVVRDRVDAQRQAQEREQAVEQIKAAVAQRCGVSPDAVETWLSRRGERDGYMQATVRIDLPIPRSKAKNPPDPHVRVAKSLGRA